MKKILILFAIGVCFGVHAQANYSENASEPNVSASLGKVFEKITGDGFSVDPSFGTLSDTRDGKTYKTVQIGTQVWMAENLNYTTITGSWAYANDPINTTIYGRLYNWETAIKACPVGWRIPNGGDWTILTEFLGGSAIAGGKMKVPGTIHWRAPNDGATNESGFSALPGGFYVLGGNFGYKGYSTYFWTTDEAFATHMAYYRMLYFNNTYFDDRGYSYKSSGFSVRCIKD